MYTPDGYMSAQLMRSDRLHFSGDDMHPDRLDELAAAASGYLTYTGSCSVVGDGLIAHDIAISLLPNWIGGTRSLVNTSWSCTTSHCIPGVLEGEGSVHVR
jgi:Lipocalin-like domain